MRYTFSSEHEAADELQANGWTPKTSDDGSAYWTKPSRVDDWYGGHACTALVSVERRDVTDGAPYFEIRFA